MEATIKEYDHWLLCMFFYEDLDVSPSTIRKINELQFTYDETDMVAQLLCEEWYS